MFLAHSVRYKLASPQAAQLSLHFFAGKLKPVVPITVRDQHKDAPLIESWEREEKKVQLPIRIELGPWILISKCYHLSYQQVLG